MANSLRVRLRFSGLVMLCAVQTLVLFEQAFHCSPTQDELGQMTASIAIARTGDLGYYRVNPPLGKLITGIPLTLLRDVPEIPSASPSYFRPGNRHQEVSMPRQYIKTRLDGYRWDFRVGRLPRVILLLLVTWGVLWWFHRRECGEGLARPEATPTPVSGIEPCRRPLLGTGNQHEIHLLPGLFVVAHCAGDARDHRGSVVVTIGRSSHCMACGTGHHRLGGGADDLQLFRNRCAVFRALFCQ